MTENDTEIIIEKIIDKLRKYIRELIKEERIKDANKLSFL